MSQGPRTFRDPFLSVYQSMMSDIARANSPGGSLEATGDEDSPKPVEVAAGELVAARSAVAAMKAAGVDTKLDQTALEDMSIPQNIQVCAALAKDLLAAKVSGDQDEVKKIEQDFLPGSKCDPQWVTTIDQYVKYFGPTGRPREIPYLKPSAVGSKVITIKSNARIGLIGDWGTGAAPATRVLAELEAQQPDIVIHLGDIYYSGTENECHANFEAVMNRVLKRAGTGIPVYTLAGNHDMYSGGVGYYALLRRLNKPPMVQPASFFCLRAEDNSWQLLAMDTGKHDFSPISVTHAETYVDGEELDWHEQRIREFPGKTILLSHHQLFSAFSQIGKAQQNGRFLSYNDRLKAAFERFQATGKMIPAWFWGHEHNLCIYKPYLGLEYGRCVGCSAIPVFSQDDPYTVVGEIDNPPDIVDEAKLSVADGIYAHGFAMLQFRSSAIAVDYFEDRNGTEHNAYSETIA
jgi:predicted phosphodiesterase